MPRRNATLDLVCAATLDTRAAGEGQPARRTFRIVGYTGEPLVQPQWDAPVVVDMDGIDAGGGRLPILSNHEPVKEAVVGQSESAQVEAGEFILRGLFMEAEKAAQDVIRLADQGFRWQASIGAQCLVKEFVEAGSTANVNGRDYPGPVYVSRKTAIREVSFVVIGADKHTSALVASGGAAVPTKMSFAQYCKSAYDMDAEGMTAKMRARVQAEYDSKDDEDEEDDTDTEDDKKKDRKDAKAAAVLDLQATLRTATGNEIARINQVQAICAKAPGLAIEVDDPADPKKKVKADLQSHALLAGWTAQQTELAFLRAEREQRHVPVPGGLGYSVGAPQLSEAVIEAAVLQAGRCQLWSDDFYKERGDRGAVPYDIRAEAQASLKARYPDQVQQHARDMYKGRIGLQQVLIAGAAMSGKRLPEVIRDDGDIETVLRANTWIRADGFSTASIANVLANVLNKFLLQGYLYVEMAWRDVCGIRPVKDFKPTKSVNLFGDFMFDDVGPDGELKHASLKDQAFANQVATTGKIITITRANIINDDLGALTAVPMLLGRGSATKLNKTFWTAFLATAGYDDGGTTAFWNATHTDAGGVSIGNANYYSGAGSAVSIAGLTQAELGFNKQIGPDLLPLGIDPAVILHPPDLKTAVWELLNSSFIVYGGSTAAKQPSQNRFVGAYRPVMSRYLSNSAFTGYSTTAWYLLAEPGVMPVIEAAFLNGQETPTVQTAQAQFDVLGISIRGFFDFGVTRQQFRAGNKNAGV